VISSSQVTDDSEQINETEQNNETSKNKTTLRISPQSGGHDMDVLAGLLVDNDSPTKQGHSELNTSLCDDTDDTIHSEGQDRSSDDGQEDTLSSRARKLLTPKLRSFTMSLSRRNSSNKQDNSEDNSLASILPSFDINSDTSNSNNNIVSGVSESDSSSEAMSTTEKLFFGWRKTAKGSPNISGSTTIQHPLTNIMDPTSPSTYEDSEPEYTITKTKNISRDRHDSSVDNSTGVSYDMIY
jgi:hypothetical protein